MKRRFSAQELFELRNTVPVDALIENVLNIPVKHSDGVFRFLCPVCNEFQTATKPAHCDDRRHALKEMLNRIGKPVSGGTS